VNAPLGRGECPTSTDVEDDPCGLFGLNRFFISPKDELLIELAGHPFEVINLSH